MRKLREGTKEVNKSKERRRRNLTYKSLLDRKEFKVVKKEYGRVKTLTTRGNV